MASATILPLDSVAYGGDYNPEQWDAETFERDLELMRAAGVNLVSLGIFSWASLEPTEGTYDLDWLAAIIDRLHAAGISVDLATGTASPPVWMARRYPQSLPVTREGVRLEFGSRQQYSPSSSVYRRASAALAGVLAQRFGDHPGVVMWHVNNEYGCHVSECFGEESRAAFRSWLQDRYQTIEALNEAWGTAFWSQRYADFAEVEPPATMPTLHNPSQLLDWRRFNNHQLLGCLLGEIESIRAHSDRPITTNFMGAFPPLDYVQWAQHLDIVSDDHYPDPARPSGAWDVAWQSDLMRGLGDGRPFLLMEQTTDAVQWRTRNSPKRPGQYELWSLQRVAHGADGILQFQWRQSRRGAETFHGGMVPHAGRAGRTWPAVVGLGETLGRLGPVVGARTEAQVAVLVDCQSNWALQAAIGPASEETDFAGAKAWHRTWWELGYAVDVVGTAADLTGYRVVVVPQIFIEDAELARRLTEFVAGGGQVIVTARSFVVDPTMAAVLGGYLGSLRELLGVRVTDVVAATGTPANDGENVAGYVEEPLTPVHRISTAVRTPGGCDVTGVDVVDEDLARAVRDLTGAAEDGLPVAGGRWAEVLAPAGDPAYDYDSGAAARSRETGVDVLARFTAEGGGADLAGLPAITRASHGSGSAYYVATDLDPVGRAGLATLVAQRGAVAPVLADLPEGVEAQRRGEHLFVLNHGDEQVVVPGVTGLDLTTGEHLDGELTLPARTARVVEPTPASPTSEPASAPLTSALPSR